MLEIILLIFLTRNIGKIAIQKGEKPGVWKLLTVLLWIVCEIIGTFLAVILYGLTPDSIFSIIAFALFSAFGGYLIIRAILTNKPDAHQR